MSDGLGDGYEVARHDGRGRLIVEVCCPDEGRRMNLAARAFNRFFREDLDAPLLLKLHGVDPHDPRVEVFEYGGHEDDESDE
jgi:hypothetical protein